MFLFVYLGSSAADLAAVLDGRVSLDRSEVVVALAGFAAVIGVVALIIRSASRVLREELQAASKSPPGS
jgi:uncharacterized membrane protein